MYCKICGTENTDSSRFCKECGAALSSSTISTESSRPEQPTSIQPSYTPAPVVEASDSANEVLTPIIEAEPGKGMAIAGMVCGIVSFFCFGLVCGILGIVFGNIAKNKGYRGGMATAGIVCGSIAIALWAFGLLIGFAFA